MSRRFRFSWTSATYDWWSKLGHLEGCTCPEMPNGGQRTLGGDDAAGIWRCWNQAVDRIVDLPARSHPHATRAMYEFRDRSTKPV